MLLPSTRARFGSTFNSGEDVAATLASSEVDERHNLGMLGSSLFTQEREAGNISVTGTPVVMYENPAETQNVCRCLIPREKGLRRTPESSRSSIITSRSCRPRRTGSLISTL